MALNTQIASLAESLEERTAATMCRSLVSSFTLATLKLHCVVSGTPRYLYVALPGTLGKRVPPSRYSEMGSLTASELVQADLAGHKETP